MDTKIKTNIHIPAAVVFLQIKTHLSDSALAAFNGKTNEQTVISVILALILFGLKSKLNSVASPTPSFDPVNTSDADLSKSGLIKLELSSCSYRAVCRV